MTFEQTEAIARGRVWAGSDAHELGLVDELGGLRAAVDHARRGRGARRHQAVSIDCVSEAEESVARFQSSAGTVATTRRS